MVVFVDLDQDALAEHTGSATAVKAIPSNFMFASLATASSDFPPAATSSDREDHATRRLSDRDVHETQDPTSNPNRNAFSAALSCYPIILEIARAVDLNTLHALSRTCRQFHVNLAQFRHQLVRETLRCENEYIETVTEMLDGGAVLPNSVKSVLQLLSQGNGELGRMTRGKVGRCARDMVSECRRCSKTVCRNCTIKPPNQTAMKGRIRRLCRACNAAPLSHHLSHSPIHAHHDPSPRDGGSPPSDIVLHTCTCDEALWLCVQCGQTIRSADTTYRRVWAWRTRYSTYLGGGLGTGIGEGSQGVKCGRGEWCLAGQEIELEVDCEADEGLSDSSSTGHSPASHPGQGHAYLEPGMDGHDEEEPGYFRQEIIGLGGVVKHKAKKRVMVGACVVEFEDERETGKYLVREECGSARSWCGWCDRVIPSKRDDLKA